LAESSGAEINKIKITVAMQKFLGKFSTGDKIRRNCLRVEFTLIFSNEGFKAVEFLRF
jgi:hypothetical protein